MEIMETITDSRIGNAILKKMCKENEVNFENVLFNKAHKYIETIDFEKKDVDFCQTEYKGKKYKISYFSGSFNPYIVSI